VPGASPPRFSVPKQIKCGEWYQEARRPLLAYALFLAGGDKDEAEDALSDALENVLKHWDELKNPLAYARRATFSNLLKNKERNLKRIRDRQIQRGDFRREAEDDHGITVWEQEEWVMQLLRSLPPAQRDVLACIIDDFTPIEIARLLGKTDAAVRQNLRAARLKLQRQLAETETKTSHHSVSAASSTKNEEAS
jgi:RNA polymerase sigma factor (sigma-70 family)